VGLDVPSRPGALQCGARPAFAALHGSCVSLSSRLQANPYRIAVHPFDGSKAVVASRTGVPVTFTRDFGQTWGNSSGVTSVGQQGNFWFGQPLAVEQQVRTNVCAWVRAWRCE
jgi:hypothetical protein